MQEPMTQVLRAAAVAVLCGLLTAVAHVASGGPLPDVAALVLLLPLLAAVLLGVAHRRRGPLAQLAVLATGQAALHVLLAVLHPHPAGVGFGADGVAMVVAHAAATVATAVLLARADDAFATVAAALRRLAPRRRPAPQPDVAAPARPVPAPGHTARVSRLRRFAAPRRGPPVWC